MAKSKTKRSKKFASSGELKRTIDARRKNQKAKKAIIASKQKRASKRGANAHGRDATGPSKFRGGEGDEAEEEDDEEDLGMPKKTKDMTVDGFLNGDFMQDSDGDEDDDADSEAEEEDDNESFASVDDLDGDEGASHMLDLKALAKKDPEFYKYLQEHDKELLAFESKKSDVEEDDDEAGMDVDGGSEVDEDEDEDEDDEEEAPVLTKELLRQWQKALLEQRSLRALRKLLIAFRSAARMNEEDEAGKEAKGWTIDNPAVFNKLIVTTIKYTPVVLNHHVPYKILPNGKFKPPTQSAKQKTLNKLILSYFYNTIHLTSQLSDPDMQQLIVDGSMKIVPYVTGSRKAVKQYLKMCLELWSTADDRVRLTAVMALRRLASASDEALNNLVLKGTYLTLVRSSKGTSMHTLPAINLMKNSASEIYCTDQGSAYMHGFGYIRQLAVHLRNSMKIKSTDSYRQVYNWQFVHSIDFWSLVLSRACDADEEARTGQESELKPLIYPLVQVAIGAIKLIPTQRYYPLHFHIIRSLLHIIRRTKVYIPLAPFLLPILSSTLSPSSKSKPTPSTLKPLDLTLCVRAPAQYLKTRAYKESIAEEAAFLLGEWCESCSNSIAFSEIMVPVVIVLRKAIKKSTSSSMSTFGKGKKTGPGKEVSHVKTLLSRLEEGMKWTEEKRSRTVDFAPNEIAKVREWEKSVRVEDTPVGKWMNVERKARERKRALIEKARADADAILEDEASSDEGEEEEEDDNS